MRTLQEIDEDIAQQSRKKVIQLMQDGQVQIIPAQGIMYLQSEARFADKYREMYGILKEVHFLLGGHPDLSGFWVDVLSRIDKL